MKPIIKPYHKMGAVYSVVLEMGDVYLATSNLVHGKAVYGEQLIKVGAEEYRLWDPYRSKLAAAIIKGLPSMPIRSGSGVLYLGAATGTTVSHVSDIVGIEGRVYAVEFSPRSLRELVNNLSTRMNVFPVLADVRLPYSYKPILEKVDVIYCDVAQPEQARILADNVELFLRTGGSALLVVKARSVDSTKKPEKVFREEVSALKHRGLKVKALTPLEPYDKDHIMVLIEG